jgi:hypothetical protein
MTFGVIKAIYRGAKRTPMNTKRGHNYYKGMPLISKYYIRIYVYKLLL